MDTGRAYYSRRHVQVYCRGCRFVWSCRTLQLPFLKVTLNNKLALILWHFMAIWWAVVQEVGQRKVCGYIYERTDYISKRSPEFRYPPRLFYFTGY